MEKWHKPINTELQRGLLKAHAERAKEEGKWLAFRANPQVRMTPEHFLELLAEGRFETTSPTEWDLIEDPLKQEAPRLQGPRPPEVPQEQKVVMPTRTHKVPMRNNKATAGRRISYYGKEKEASVPAPPQLAENLYNRALPPMDRMWYGIQRLKSIEAEEGRLGAEKAKVTAEIQKCSQELNGKAPQADVRPVAVPATPRPKRRVKTRNIAYGIRTAILQEILDHGPQTKQELVQRLVGKFRQNKVEGNLWPMTSEGVIVRGDDGRFALGSRWTKTRAAHRVQRAEAVTE